MGSLNPESDPKQELNDSGCVQDSSESYKGQAELLDLSDDVLLYILKLCSPRDLKALGHTCPRLGILICDRTLWQRVDARSGPTGQERLRWLLTHCLTPATQELKLTGYVNRDTRCLGIQDLTWPISGEPGASRSAPGVDVEHFLLRMWYSHLPRYAMSPRWPDKREAAGKAYSTATEGAKPPLSPLSQLASEIVAGTSTASTSSISDLSNSGPNSSNSGPNSSNSGPNSSKSGPCSSNSGPSSSSSGPRSSSNCPSSSNDGGNSSNSGPNSSDSELNSGEAKDEMDDIVSSCHGPQFTLNHNLLKTLRSKCQNLSSLALEYCNLDYRNANIRYFPTNLKKLSLKGTRCYNLPLNTSYLGKIQDRLPELEYLDISECEWFEPASLMPLSKVKHLQELYMRDCRRLTECVAYASLATRYGFQKLRILDVRGSPVADSEVSAFGWLPLLEELYVSPPDDFRTCTEHSHKWDDVLAPFTELDSWETDEPDYYKCKSPPVEFMDEDEDLKEDGEGLPEERLGDVMLGNYITCASLERRIIVIHPNRQNQNREDNQPSRPVDPPPAAEPQPSAEQAQDPGLQPGPSRNLKRPYPSKVLNLAKKRFHVDVATGEDDEEESDQRPSDSELMNKSNPESSSPKPSASETANIPSAAVAVNIPTASEANISSASASSSQSSDIDLQPSNLRTATSSTSSGNQTPRINIELGLNPSPESSRRGLSPIRSYPDPRENPEGVRPCFARYFNRIASAMSQNTRPPLAVHARPIHDRPSIDGRSIDTYIWDCPDMPRRGCLPRPSQAQRARRIDINIQRANLSLPREFQHLGYHLVSDSAVLRFGRAENDNINYVHIGHNFHGNDPGVRPDRSNLRILSVTGYRNITDRSLEHLATAAPYLRHIDFSYSSVSERGVEVFKAIRPNCEVVFSKFDRDV